MRHDHLYVHCPKTKIVQCDSCGEAVEVGWKRKRPIRCTPCAEAAITSAIRQMAGKSGPVYERWITGISDFIDRTKGGNTTPTENLPP